MANFKQQCFLRFSLQLLVLSSFLMSLTDTERAEPNELKGEVGGNVTFRCPVQTQRKITALYFQKGDVYINGYHLEKNISTVQPWQNTRVDNKTNEVHMFELNMSHSGDYKCFIFYERGNMDEIVIRLNVTGKFTRPSVTMSCRNETHFRSCIVTCTSHGGFPSSNMMWNLFGTNNTSNNIWKFMNTSNVENLNTQLFTSSSTSLFKCYREELKFSCSVGNVTSEEHTVCTHQNEEDPPNLYWIIAACLVFVVLFIVGLVYCKCKKRSTGTADQGVMQELKSKEDEVEITVLTESKEETEAS